MTTIEREPITCWCCDEERPESGVVRLGTHPEVAICLRCARELSNRGQEVEDHQRPSLATRGRDLKGAGRQFVIHHDLAELPVVGPLLKWIGRHTP
jgi:hypothetical protein